MTLHVYVDGSASPTGKFCYFIEETGKSSICQRDPITNKRELSRFENPCPHCGLAIRWRYSQ